MTKNTTPRAWRSTCPTAPPNWQDDIQRSDASRDATSVAAPGDARPTALARATSQPASPRRRQVFDNRAHSTISTDVPSAWPSSRAPACSTHLTARDAIASAFAAVRPSRATSSIDTVRLACSASSGTRLHSRDCACPRKGSDELEVETPVAKKLRRFIAGLINVPPKL